VSDQQIFRGVPLVETRTEKQERRIRELEERARRLEAELDMVRERIAALRRGEDPA